MNSETTPQLTETSKIPPITRKKKKQLKKKQKRREYAQQLEQQSEQEKSTNNENITTPSNTDIEIQNVDLEITQGEFNNIPPAPTFIEGTEEYDKALTQWEQEEKDFQEKWKKIKQEKEMKQKQEEAYYHRHSRGKNQDYQIANYGTEKDSKNCSFFLKTGSCRFGESCSKFHPYPNVSNTLLFKNMYDGLGMSEPTDENNTDDLEYDEDEITDHFYNFWDDTLPVLKEYGDIDQIRVCRNHSYHLRGNVYVMYKNTEDAEKAYTGLQGRFYGGKPLIILYSPILQWKSAICGHYLRNQCERGKNCNFLHVFNNPKGYYEENLISRGRYDRDRDSNNHDERDYYRNDRYSDDKENNSNHRSKDSHKHRHYSSRSRDKKRQRSHSPRRSLSPKRKSSSSHRSKRRKTSDTKDKIDRDHDKD